MYSTIRVCMVASAVALLTACGSGKQGGAAVATQVAVKVNGDEISVHQVNAQLARLTNVPAESREGAKKQLVDGLIDQQLFIQAALTKKLDRDPEVLAALEASRQQILAQAYVQKALATQGKPGDEEIKKYYADNPALFSGRRLYRLQEVATSLPAARVPELEAQIKKSKGLNDVVTWLQAGGFQVAANAAVRAAEQLPLAAVARISQLHDGEMEVFTTDNRVTVLQVVASQPQPLSEKEAAPFIEQFLTSRKRDELARGELKKLRETAKIEYVGEYAKASRNDAAAPKSEATADKTDAGAEKVKAATAAEPAVNAAPNAAPSMPVDQGVKGLR